MATAKEILKSIKSVEAFSSFVSCSLRFATDGTVSVRTTADNKSASIEAEGSFDNRYARMSTEGKVYSTDEDSRADKEKYSPTEGHFPVDTDNLKNILALLKNAEVSFKVVPDAGTNGYLSRVSLHGDVVYLLCNDKRYLIDSKVCAHNSARF